MKPADQQVGTVMSVTMLTEVVNEQVPARLQ